MTRTLVGALLLGALAGCGLETQIFPLLGPQPLAEPPAPLGPYATTERRIELADLGDGRPGAITVFEPAGAAGPRPTLVWVLGVNNQPYYHQSFHEYMASWGYIDVVPDTRLLSFVDLQYNKRNTDIARRAFALAVENAYGLASDPARIAFGGYSAGGSMAAFAAAQEPQARALVMWVPAAAWIWLGVNPDELLPRVQAPALFLLAEYDRNNADWPLQMQAQMVNSAQTVMVIAGGTHLSFQEPDVPQSTDPPALLTRAEQMRQALTITRDFLDEQLAISR
jgi:dienelactone hydrolase